MLDPDRELEWLRRLRELSARLAVEHDTRALLPAIVDAAIELTRAERGFLVRVGRRAGSERVRVKVELARGFDQEVIAPGADKVSRTVVDRVLEERRTVLTTSEEDRDIQDKTSVKERRVLAILGVPLRLRGVVTGVLYLDHRFVPRVFTAQDLPIVEAFADQAALALETAELLERDREATERLETLEGQLVELEEARRARECRVDPRPASDLGLSRMGALVGGSRAMRDLYGEIERASRARAPLLLTGESGTGKELVAREIHARSDRRGEPFVALNCGAVPESLLESELFGHRKGAFTGASSDRRGLFLEAGAGTIFLDEVGDTSAAMQRALLRVLQEEQVRPVGGGEAVPLGCRVVAASQHDLQARVRAGAFREDLFYRLDVLRLHVPPLRQRREDVPLLLQHFLDALGVDLEVGDEALRALVGFSWPGNVRQLRNEASRLASLDVRAITAAELSPELRGAAPGPLGDGRAYAGKTMEQVQREAVAAALRGAGGNKAQAARQLGIPKSTFYELVKRYGLA